jgi:excisionase family DNA binding protein
VVQHGDMNHLQPVSIAPAALHVDKAAEYAGCGKSTMYDYLAAGRLRRVRHGRRTVVLVADLDRLLAELAEESAA